MLDEFEATTYNPAYWRRALQSARTTEERDLIEEQIWDVAADIGAANVEHIGDPPSSDPEARHFYLAATGHLNDLTDSPSAAERFDHRELLHWILDQWPAREELTTTKDLRRVLDELAASLWEDMSASARSGEGPAIVDLVTPFGKPLMDCTREEIVRLGAWLEYARVRRTRS